MTTSVRDDGSVETTRGIPSAAMFYTVPEACDALRVSRWMLYRLIQSKRLRTIKIGSRRLIPVTSLRRFVEDLASSAEAD